MTKIYIGVGHGGTDPGAVSGKHKEAAYALDIATACTAELKRHGLSVMQSRTSDVTETAAAKVKECNAYGPDLALDIHLNAGGGDGFEIFRSVTGGKGQILAQKIEAAVKATGQNSRGIKTKKTSTGKDYFGFIRQTSCPAVLVEAAFIDSKDVQAVDTLAERQKMGKAIAHGVLATLGMAVKVEQPAGGSTVKVETVAVSLPMLKRGSGESYQVKRVQLCLNQMGYTGADDKALTVDGNFGANTAAAIEKLQKAHGIPASGAMTAQTWRALLVYLR